jgi:hypothetical protein
MLPDIDPSSLGGLSEQEAATRLRAEGANELPSVKARLLAITWEVVRETMLLLLVGAGRSTSPESKCWLLVGWRPAKD